MPRIVASSFVRVAGVRSTETIHRSTIDEVIDSSGSSPNVGRIRDRSSER
jgi:hypothetical protein